ncbi:Uncharacterised protein [Vibrio cholerae]|nr:Uncharacterised protein [Vibrio cholerae]CSI63669.1 Uncharacterised protein [Vibrio cholerae]
MGIAPVAKIACSKVESPGVALPTAPSSGSNSSTWHKPPSASDKPTALMPSLIAWPCSILLAVPARAPAMIGI